ncbi:MAG: glycosyltransferase, partial [Planctomycetota bacterium]
MPDSCDVLLATFNGAPFLAEQLDSLLAQDRDDFRVLARDDGSTDGTADILADYLPKFGGRMTILPTENGSGSATANFGILMAASDAERLLFCDQDDVWGPRKVGLTLDLLDAAVAERGPDVPALVFTDVTPVDAALRPLGDSFWAYKKVRPEVSADLRASLVCGTLLGCAMAVNRA